MHISHPLHDSDMLFLYWLSGMRFCTEPVGGKTVGLLFEDLIEREDSSVSMFFHTYPPPFTPSPTNKNKLYPYSPGGSDFNGLPPGSVTCCE